MYIFYHVFTCVRFFRSEFEKCLNIVTKYYNLGKKIGKEKQEWKDSCIIARLPTRMQKSLMMTQFTSQVILFKNVGISKCNFHLLWVTTIFGFVIMSPNVSNLGY